MGFVQYDKLEDALKSVEEVFDAHGLDANEKEFLIKQLMIRIQQKQQKQKMSDLVTDGISNSAIKNVMNKMMGRKDE